MGRVLTFVIDRRRISGTGARAARPMEHRFTSRVASHCGTQVTS
jgi:hypothetical protein